MKKFLFLGILGLLLSGCQGEEVPELPENNSDIANSQINLVEICHYDSNLDQYFVISINENAILGHVGHGDIYDMDGDGYYPENPCGLDGGMGAYDCDDSDAEVYPGNGCLACEEYAWSELLNTIDFTYACQRYGYLGVRILFIYGLNENYCCYLVVYPDGSWGYAEDNVFLFVGSEPAESYDCFVEFLNDINVPECNL